MNIYDRIVARRAIKYFQPKAIITDEVINDILKTARKLPLRFGAVPWRIVRIQDQALRRSVRQIGFDQPQYTDASVLLALCFDCSVFTDALARNGSPHLLAHYADSQRLRDEAMQSTAMFAQSIMLSAAAWSIDSCPMIGFQFDPVSRLLDLPEHVLLVMFVALGVRERDPLPRGSRLSVRDTLIMEHFNSCIHS